MNNNNSLDSQFDNTLMRLYRTESKIKKNLDKLHNFIVDCLEKKQIYIKNYDSSLSSMYTYLSNKYMYFINYEEEKIYLSPEGLQECPDYPIEEICEDKNQDSSSSLVYIKGSDASKVYVRDHIYYPILNGRKGNIVSNYITSNNHTSLQCKVMVLTIKSCFNITDLMISVISRFCEISEGELIELILSAKDMVISTNEGYFQNLEIGNKHYSRQLERLYLYYKEPNGTERKVKLYKYFMKSRQMFENKAEYINEMYPSPYSPLNSQLANMFCISDKLISYNLKDLSSKELTEILDKF